MCFVHMFFVPNWVVHVCCLLWERLEHQLLDRRHRKTLQPKLIYLPKYLLPIFTVEIATSLPSLKDNYSKLNLFTLKANWLDLFTASENIVAMIINWLKMKVNAANMACYPYLCFFYITLRLIMWVRHHLRCCSECCSTKKQYSRVMPCDSIRSLDGNVESRYLLNVNANTTTPLHVVTICTRSFVQDLHAYFLPLIVSLVSQT